MVDAADDADFQVVVLALIRAEASGKTFVYRTGPSFVRARTGQQPTPAVDAARLAEIVAQSNSGLPDEGRPSVPHGLIAVGSHVGLTTRQLDQLRATGNIVSWSWTCPPCWSRARAIGTSPTSRTEAANLFGTTLPTVTS